MRGFCSVRKAAIGWLLIAITGGLISGCFPNLSSDNGQDNTDKLFTVRQSDLIIGSVLRGTANAKKIHRLFPDATYKNTLTWIAEENTHVKKGDLVIQFETRDLLDAIEARELLIESQEKNLDIRREEKRVIISENQSILRVSQDNVESAEEAYARYYKYDGRKRKEVLEVNVATKEKNHEEAEEAYQNKQDTISNTVYEDENAREKAFDQLEQLKSSMLSKERIYEDALYDLRIFKKYTYPNTLTEKENKLIQSRLNLERTLVSTASKVVQKENEIRRLENELRKHIKEFDRLSSYLPLMEISAPVDGILVYGDMDSRRDRNIEIELGMDVKRKLVIATIPEMDNLIVDFELPEQFLHRIGIGAKAIMTPDSMPGLKIHGQVSKIAVVPVNQIVWDKTSPKVYHSIITLDKQNENIVSGMNVQVEIIEDTLIDAVNVPVEAVFEEEGDFFVFLQKGAKAERQVVELGKSNDQYVQIRQGLEVGDRVYLYSPFELEDSE